MMDSFDDGLEDFDSVSTPADKVSDGELEQKTVTIEANGLKVTLDIREMLTAIDPNGRYLGYDHDAEEDVYEPSAFVDAIVERAAAMLTKHVKKSLRESIENRVNATIDAQLTEIVRAHLEAPVQKTNEWGGKIGAPRPLKEVIIEKADEALTKPMGDSYSRTRPTMVQKIVADAVGSAFTRELAGAVGRAKADAMRVVEQQAAAVIRETIERAAAKGGV